MGDRPYGPPPGAPRPWGDADNLKRRAAWERSIDVDRLELTTRKRPRTDDHARLAFLTDVNDAATTPSPVFYVVEVLARVFSYLDIPSRGRLRTTNWTLMRVGGYDACWAEGVDISNVWKLPVATPKMTLCAYRLAYDLGLAPSLVERLDFLHRQRGHCEAALRRMDTARDSDVSIRAARMDDIRRATELLDHPTSPPNITQTRQHRKRIEWCLSCVERLQVRKLRRNVAYLWWHQKLVSLEKAVGVVRAKLVRVGVFRAYPPMRSAWAFYDEAWDELGISPHRHGQKAEVGPPDAFFFVRPSDFSGLDESLALEP